MSNYPWCVSIERNQQAKTEIDNPGHQQFSDFRTTFKTTTCKTGITLKIGDFIKKFEGKLNMTALMCGKTCQIFQY